MVKRAPLDILLAGTVQPGKYLVLAGGQVGDVEEAVDAGRQVAAEHLIDEVFLADIHPRVVEALVGTRMEGSGEALGIIETATVAAVIEAADAGIKGANVTLREIRLADGLGGKAYLLFDGVIGEVEVSVQIGTDRIPGQVLGSRVIAQLHPEMDENLAADARFSRRIRGA